MVTALEQELKNDVERDCFSGTTGRANAASAASATSVPLRGILSNKSSLR